MLIMAFMAENIVKNVSRKCIVFTSLISLLTLTSMLLLALAPAPLMPDAASSLFAVDKAPSLEILFNTQIKPQPEQWKYIYIHHSRTASGNALTLGQNAGGLGDHFVIGNGNGGSDGEIQYGRRWNQQLSATTVADPNCISICLVGDFDRTLPTSAQVNSLAQLVGTLQGRLNIAGSDVLWIDRQASATGIGSYFPKTVFREQLLP